ncbi:hypothetical protein EV421DRAFT_1736309 [Armillaria borealis]|uniref:Uncharacterized protein n=1 Tax=Armillaria borealis TaxID=47425 RepID=A0AA39MQF0_9AGAR|nr:hypothetical protein EV421DRAFT_1736309 [Armillaria borealis]
MEGNAMSSIGTALPAFTVAGSTKTPLSSSPYTDSPPGVQNGTWCGHPPVIPSDATSPSPFRPSTKRMVAINVLMVLPWWRDRVVVFRVVVINRRGAWPADRMEATVTIAKCCGRANACPEGFGAALLDTVEKFATCCCIQPVSSLRILTPQIQAAENQIFSHSNKWRSFSSAPTSNKYPPLSFMLSNSFLLKHARLLGWHVPIYLLDSKIEGSICAEFVQPSFFCKKAGLGWFPLLYNSYPLQWHTGKKTNVCTGYTESFCLPHARRVSSVTRASDRKTLTLTFLGLGVNLVTALSCAGTQNHGKLVKSSAK